MITNRQLVALDLLAVPLVVYGSFVVRLEVWWPQEYLGGLLLALLFYPTAMLAALYRSGAYRSYWPYASLRELRILVRAVLTGVTIAAAATLLIGWWQPAWAMPRSISVLMLPFGLAAVAVPRIAVRLAAQRAAPASERGEPVLVIGAGAAGAMTLRELQANPRLGLRAVGLIDDDPAKRGVLLHGVPVLGGRERIAAAAQQYGVSRAIIAISSAAGDQIRALHAICMDAGLQVQIVPGLLDLLSGGARLNQLRPVAITDLLRRAAVQTDTAAVAAMLHGRTVLVSGGGGSIGSELCRQLLRCEPAALLVLGHGENSVFEIEAELRRLSAGLRCAPRIEPLIADVRESARLRSLLATYRPDTIFHAAAHKHVPLMELHPREAVATNIFGTLNLLTAARESGVERFVLISTDKAVNPTSVMGATKRVAELLVREAALHDGRHYVAVRFGNVLGSRGSVVQTFQRQIAAGGPLTITDPHMTRYFMTIPEAVQLVLQAAQIGEAGDLFMLDMGRPVRILDLARDMIQLSGLQEGRDIAIVISGRRPGEKLDEELLRPDEGFARSAHPAIFVARPTGQVTQRPAIERQLQRLQSDLLSTDDQRVRRALQELVPEYRPAEDEREVPHAIQPAVAD